MKTLGVSLLCACAVVAWSLALITLYAIVLMFLAVATICRLPMTVVRWLRG